MQPNNHVNQDAIYQNTHYFGTSNMTMPITKARQSITINHGGYKVEWAGLTRQQVMQKCNDLGLNTVCFARWLAIYEFRILLVFKNNRCVVVEHL
ncbi:hypothetical protein VH441_03995 [Psychrobacter sp. HD31]|uniref:hypothetical protein n=1 Tax=Psychrobacter sp. HD31 TaxID=3112003 RepID=UPI003DA36F9F